MSQDIRWQQRFSNYRRALEQLSGFMQKTKLDELQEQGLIQAFEYTHELAWKTQQDFLKERGVKDIFGSKDTTREAFNLDLIEDGHVWMEMIKDRNLTSHTYNQEVASKIIGHIRRDYYKAFVALEKRLAEFEQ